MCLTSMAGRGSLPQPRIHDEKEKHGTELFPDAPIKLSTSPNRFRVALASGLSGK